MLVHPSHSLQFDVVKNAKIDPYTLKSLKHVPVLEYANDIQMVREKEARVLLATQNSPFTIRASLGNGLAGTAFKSYNQHHTLKLSPDHIWMGIIASLTHYMDKIEEKTQKPVAERLRHIFVNHEGKEELIVYGKGSIKTANYGLLVDQMSQEIAKKTKPDIRDWIECNFTTTTPTTKLVSQIMLMGCVKNFFDYKFQLECNLPRVILEGTREDWVMILNRVKRLATWKDDTLTQWSQVLESVLQNFVNAFDGKIDQEWWNRIAHENGGGSGPRYLSGWIIAFTPWTDNHQYVLKSIEEIQKTGFTNYGRMETSDVPGCHVDVPITIDDNGREYKTIFHAGLLMTAVEDNGQVLTPSVDWILLDVTK